MQLFDTFSLKLFRSVCEEKSIAHAAQNEGTVPSAVSKRISAMEELIGVQLLERGTRGVEATDAGNILLRYACRILDLMEQMHSELSNFSGRIQGSICIFSPVSEFAWFLGKDIGDFLLRYENVRATIIEKVAMDTIRAVEEGRADIGVCYEVADTHLLRRLPYRANTLSLVVRRSHPLASKEAVSFADIIEFDMVKIPGILLERMQKMANAMGKLIHSRIQVATIEAACDAVVQGLGVAIVPCELVDPSDDLAVIPIDDDWAHQHFIICTKSEDQLTLPTRLLVESLTANAARDEKK
jgi:DNA-binding transcriptional LysR family regulator